MKQKKIITELLRETPESQFAEIIDFLLFLRMKHEKSTIQDILEASLSSVGFWDNPDDEVWDHV